jgi:parallel beta-helix repeat protein
MSIFFYFSKMKVMLHKNTATFSSLSFRRLLLGGIFALLTTFALQAQTIRYVKATAAGTGNGSSWANASADFQAMINASASGDAVWVAAGTYKPTRDPFGATSPGDPRNKTFYVKDGVKIYGGFSASAPEVTLAARSITSNVTTLSGDIGTVGVATDNAYHVVLASAARSNGVGVTVDGFAITGGNANDPNYGAITVNGFAITRYQGGGIYTNYGTNTLSNNTIYSNLTLGSGGGIYTYYGTNTISNNTIYSNSAIGSSYSYGGGISTDVGTNTISNNTIHSNSAIRGGGGITENNSTSTLSNNIFWANKKGTDATVATADYTTFYGTNTFKNNLFQLTSSSYNAGNNNALGVGSSGNIFATDPLFVATTAPFDLRLQANSPCINRGVMGAGIPTTDITGGTRVVLPDLGAYEYNIPCATAAPTAYTVTGSGNYCTGGVGLAVGLPNSETGVSYQLINVTTSANVGAAVSGTTGAAITFGNQKVGTYLVVAKRTADDCVELMTGNAVITSSICCPSANTVYVNASVSGGTGDGSSWENAYSSLPLAFDVVRACSNVKRIRVAAGTYLPTQKPFNDGIEIITADARDLTFHVPDGITIEGGYNANTGARDIAANITTLSGDIGAAGIATDNAYHVVIASAPSSGGIGVTIDGFSITGGNADYINNDINSYITINASVIYKSYGSGIFTNRGTNTISNNTIYSNSAYHRGGGIGIEYGTNTLSNNTIYSNSVYYGNGGGIGIEYGTNTLSNNSIYSNSANNSGGGIYVYYGTNTLSNNTIYNNTTGTYSSINYQYYGSGGAIYTFGDGSTNTISNNIIYGNTAYNNGGGIATIGSTNTLSNNTIYSNLAYYGGGGGGVANFGGTNKLTNNIFWANTVFGTSSRGDYYTNSIQNVVGPSTNTFKNNLFQLASSNYSLGSGSSGNLFNQNPLFLSTTANTINLRLQAGSPCINAGITGVGIPTTDILGVARTGIPDLGAYEFIECITPTVYEVTGTGSYCGGDDGRAVGLANSELGVSYQLKNGATFINSVAGTGSAISFGLQTLAGTYTVVATRTLGGCTATMTSSALISIVNCCPSGNTLHVNADVSGGTGDGSSWANAYSNLSTALVKAYFCGNIKNIKVAAGTYKPTKKPFDNGIQAQTSTIRDFTFQIPDGVTIEGGYNASTGARDITANVTTLSGDIGSDGINTDNCYIVVLASAASSGGVGVMVDGFTITGGNATGGTPTGFTINGNSIYGSGVGFFAYYGTNTIRNCSITNNAGGGININYGTNTINNNTISGSSLASYGGGIYANYGTNTISYNTISNNTVSYRGGGINISNGTNTISYNTIFNNRADNNNINTYGGGIAIEGGANTLNHNNIYYNTADQGSGIFAKTGTNTINNNTIRENQAGDVGGGLYTEDATNTILSNTIYSNTAFDGAGIYTTRGTNKIINNSIYKNDAQDEGGGIFMYAGTNKIINNSIFYNSAKDGSTSITFAPGGGGGLFTEGGTNNTILNNLFWSNYIQYTGYVRWGEYYSRYYTSSPHGNTFKNNYMQFDYPASATGYTVGYAGIGTSASGNIFYSVTGQNPLIESFNTPDLNLQWGSPCINTGVFDADVPTTDITGAVRQGYPDIGAFEFKCLLPIAYEVTGTGAYCAGSSGAAVGLSNSQSGVTYQLKNEASTVVATVSGTGAAISFGNKTIGTYTVVATKAAGGCTATMNGSATITINSLPPAYTVTGGGVLCAGNDGGLSIGLSNSVTGVSYQLKRNGNNVGSPMIGTGAALAFGNYFDVGTYTIVATNAQGCTATMTGIAIITLSTLSGNYTVTGSGTYCTGTDGVVVGLSGTQTSVSYQLQKDNANVGTPIIGTGAAISFGKQTAGVYTIIATSTAGCTVRITSSATVTKMNCAVLSGTQTIIAKDPANLVVTIAGGVSPYTIVYSNGASNITVNNYVSGANIVVTPSVTTNYTLVSMKDATNTSGLVSGVAVVTAIPDTTPPTITALDDIIDACGVPNPLPISSQPTVTDNAKTTPTLVLVTTVTGTLTTAHTALKYTKYYIRTWRATDNNGNTATKTQNVYLRDNIAPIVTCKNPIITVGTADVTITGSTLVNTATDNCVASPTLSVCRGLTTCLPYSSSVKLPVSLIPAGQTQTTVQVSLRATDGLNAGYCTAVVTLVKGASTLANNNSNTTIKQNVISDSNEAGNSVQATEKQSVSMKCYPNPFSDDLNINYNLISHANNVTLKVYDNQGRLITTHQMNEQRAGNYDMRWNLSDLASGMYHVCLEIDGKCMKMERVIMMK